MELNTLAKDAEVIVKKAGEILLSYFRRTIQVHRKHHGGLVTEADLASENFLKAELGKLLPEAAFWAEESGKSGEAEYHWVIDPLDGTTNFAHGLPYFCISVALTHNHNPIVGIIYQPLLNECFTAVKGEGAFCNNQQIMVSEVKSMAESMIVVGLPYVKSGYYRALLQDFKKVALKSFAVRHFGAAALDLAYVAAGRLDAVFFEKLGWWDVAAGRILIEESKGIITDFEGLPIFPDFISCLASSRSLHQPLQELLKKE